MATLTLYAEIEQDWLDFMQLVHNINQNRNKAHQLLKSANLGPRKAALNGELQELDRLLQLFRLHKPKIIATLSGP